MSSSTSIIPNPKPLVQIAPLPQSRVIHFSHTWIIDNFSHRFDCSTSSSLRPTLLSSDTSFTPEDKQTFALLMYPNGKTEGSSGYLSLFLVNTYEKYWCPLKRLLDYDGHPLVGCKFAIVNDKGNKCYVQETQNELYYYFRNFRKSDCLKELGFEKYISLDELFAPENGFLEFNRLTIFVEISYLTDENKTLTLYNLASFGSSDESSELGDHSNLLTSGKLSDVVFIVSGRKFRLHKTILASRSPVFRAMFKQDLIEKKQNRVDIPDVKIEVFQQLFSYIYSGKCDSIGQNTEELLIAADKYEVIVLKTECEQHMCTKLSIETALDLLMFAEMHNSEKLKTEVLDFMKSQSRETIRTMIKANLELLLDMFRFMEIKSEQKKKWDSTL